MKAVPGKSNQENKSKSAADHVFQKRSKKTDTLQLESPGIEADRPGIEKVIQRAGLAPGSLTSQDVLQLHRTIGNQAVGRLLAGPLQKKENENQNKTGMPDHLKSGIEQLSGIDISDAQVHYNSSEPARFQALAYTQGTNIHVAPGQEKHLPHESWHMVQQKQNRVKPTMQMKDTAINDDPILEKEADMMGTRAVREGKGKGDRLEKNPPLIRQANDINSNTAVQRRVALSKKKMTGNFVELTSIDYGLQLSGGPVELIKDSDFSKMTEVESLAIVAHGAAGASGDYKASEIATYLTDQNTGLKKNIKGITFTSCYAGLGEKQIDDSDSVVAVLKSALDKEGLTKTHIIGARGPSIKSIGLKTLDFTVTDVNKLTTIEAKAYGLKATLSAASVLESLLKELRKPQEAAEKAINTLQSTGDTQKDLAAKAEAARIATARFYLLLVDAIKNTNSSAVKNVLDSGAIVITDAMAKNIGTKWGIPKLSGDELKDAVYGALAHRNLLLERNPMKLV